MFTLGGVIKDIKIYDPKDWKIIFSGKSRICENDIIYYLIIGENKNSGPYKIKIFMSKINYEKILNEEYKVVRNSDKELITLLDENSLEVDLVRQEFSKVLVRKK